MILFNYCLVDSKYFFGVDFLLESSLGVCKVVSEKYWLECVFIIIERVFKIMLEIDELLSKLVYC